MFGSGCQGALCGNVGLKGPDPSRGQFLFS